MGPRLPQPANELDPDAGTVTVAITFRFAPWASIDKCDTGYFLGEFRQQLVRWLLDGDDGFGRPANPTDETGSVVGFSYTCWDPCEETDLGNITDYSNATCVGCNRPARQRPLGHPHCWEWEHVDPIPVGSLGLLDCHHLAHQVAAGDLSDGCSRCPDGRVHDQYLVRFGNLLDVDLTKLL